MRKIAIKLCGLNTERAVEAAAGLGPDFAGFVIYPRSPRHVSPETMQRLKARLQAGTKTVAVLADPDDALLEQVMHTAAPDYLQLHGAEQASRLHHIRDRYHVRLIKALPVRTANDIDRASAFENAADILLFDAL
ncbi:MAG: phosphoribosylanthranilate isomerase, partial [Alphaproteobacteria bacterium]|nr:phosphoribosylanthranilate isomerase [Alphaproteobacteria bacterium]